MKQEQKDYLIKLIKQDMLVGKDTLENNYHTNKKVNELISDQPYISINEQIEKKSNYKDTLCWCCNKEKECICQFDLVIGEIQSIFNYSTYFIKCLTHIKEKEWKKNKV